MIIIALIFITICVVLYIRSYIKNNEQKKEYNKKLNSVVPGTLLVCGYQKNPDNPFVIPENDSSSIKILEVRKNTTGEIWIKYAYKVINQEYAEKYPFYDKLENKLRLYPNIVLPK